MAGLTRHGTTKCRFETPHVEFEAVWVDAEVPMLAVYRDCVVWPCDGRIAACAADETLVFRAPLVIRYGIEQPFELRLEDDRWIGYFVSHSGTWVDTGASRAHETLAQTQISDGTDVAQPSSPLRS